VTGSETYHGNALPYSILPDSEIRKISEAIFQVMREIGIKFDLDPRAMDLFSDAGCDVSADGIVKFPIDLVKHSLDLAGKSIKIWNRSATDFIKIGVKRSVFWAGITCINVIDSETGERRPSTKDDLAAITKLGDALMNIDGICLPCKMTEKADARGEMEEFAVMVENTTKPLKYLCQYVEPLQAAIDIAASVRGGLDRLKEKPYFIFTISPMPLCYAQHNIDQIFLVVENGIPANLGGMSIGGASTPITHAGNIVSMMATDFAGIVLVQLIKEGSFCMVGSLPAFMNPLTGSLGGIGEIGPVETARRQTAGLFGLPTSSWAGVSLSAQFNQDAVFELTKSMLQTAHSRAADYVSVGSIEGLLTYSPHALLFCNDIIGHVRHVLKGITVDDERLAFDIIKTVGIGGDFLSEMHTARHCRTEMHLPKYSNTMTYDTWVSRGRKDLVDRIDEDLQNLLQAHQVEPLSSATEKSIDAILKEHGASPGREQNASRIDF
jgi:trimethylamine--corrinoid protein Co-methyltransferase